MAKKQNKNEKETRAKEYLDPETNRFKEGNPGGGRPKGSKDFSTVFSEAVKKIAKTQDIDPKSVEVDLVLKAISEAKKGNYNFWRDIFDRNYGKPLSKIDIESKGEKITDINITYVDKINETKPSRDKGVEGEHKSIPE